MLKQVQHDGRGFWQFQKYLIFAAQNALHHLKQASSVTRAFNLLLDKELIYEDKGTYRIYDMFLSQWLREL
ncbi:MAG: hypothetical protein LBE91_16240 [Tannerella sp.]|jgi:hypothetical protein|nr:hypothetical protein [Tannerella sp.]